MYCHQQTPSAAAAASAYLNKRDTGRSNGAILCVGVAGIEEG